MADFKIGDRVRICRESEYADQNQNVGTIAEYRTDGTYHFRVIFDDGYSNYYRPEDLIKEGEDEMAEVNIADKLRQAELSDDNKKLIDRGLMNDDLTLTEAGKQAFAQYQLSEAKAAFVAKIEALGPPKQPASTPAGE